MQIILASKSSFRKRALEILGLKYTIIPSDFDEKSIREENPMLLAEKLAEAKARAIGDKNSDSLVIAGDLFVVFKGKIYEKPLSEEEAFEMLKTFSGNKIDIIAGVAVYNSKTIEMLSTAKKYTVKFRELLDYEIKDYISRYPVLDISGSFEIDGLLRFAESSTGHFPFLAAYPMNELILFLRKNGLKV